MRPWAQQELEGLNAWQYSTRLEEQKVEYLRIGKGGEEPRKTLLFLQGSQPIPLVFDLNGTQVLSLPFDFMKLEQDWNFVVISPPETPVIADQDHLNDQYNFIPEPSDKNALAQSYLDANYLENYVARTEAVIKDLKRQAWVKPDELHLIGHSQGAKIATVVAAGNPDVVSLNLLGFNPAGRFEEMIRRERRKMEKGEITGLEYDKNIHNYYKIWTEIRKEPNSNKIVWSDPNRTWTSFSIDYVPYLLKVEAPIRVVFGTEDIIAERCEQLPLTFIDAGKENLLIRPYAGLDHNFFEVEDGKPNYEKGHWDLVLKHTARFIYQIDRAKGREK